MVFYRNSIRDDVCTMGRSPTTGEKTVLEDCRTRLQARIDTFHQKVQAILGENMDEFPVVQPAAGKDDEDQDWYEDEEEGDDEAVGERPEDMTLAMPSTFGEE